MKNQLLSDTALVIHQAACYDGFSECEEEYGLCFKAANLLIESGIVKEDGPDEEIP